ncbi:1-deoxy-D-xylulose 5-phosphate reductoisomerase [Candidatus Rubidus massiliensis]|nr:1-deoxy-D-xylulose 5-phosphate reductoisomerase [Candidatus Rubidus massiliensis]
MKKISILGSTGSIGVNTLNVVRHLKEQFSVEAIAAHSNIDLLEKQAKEFNPKIIAVFDETKALDLKKRMPQWEIVTGLEGLKAVATYSSVELVICAMSGTKGIIPTVEAINAKKTIGLANKEALVSAGAYIIPLAHKNNVEIIPIDSEHSALFQCLRGENLKEVSRLIITASGGPFLNYTDEQLKSVTAEQALRHPNWSMGPKVTIDSSTLMNKGLEIIEAHWLFNIPLSQIDVIIHPQSIIHSMVEFQDRSIMAQMGEPSMITPIQFALTYPNRMPGLLKPFNLLAKPTLEFFEPNFSRFRCLRLAYEAMEKGGSLPCFMNAANEILVHSFLQKKITWNQIGEKLDKLMHLHKTQTIDSLETILEIDQIAREEAKKEL